MSEYTVIRQMDEKYAPPDQPVLMVAVIGNITYLEIATLEENHKTSTLTKIQTVVVPTPELIRALWSGHVDEQDRQHYLKNGDAEARRDKVGVTHSTGEAPPVDPTSGVQK